MQRIWCIFFNAWSGGWPELVCISGSRRCWMEEPFFVLSALWSVCGFPIAISSRHFGNFTPPARQSGKGWQGGFKYWVMRIINQGPSADFLLFFIFCLRAMSSWGAASSGPLVAVWMLTGFQVKVLDLKGCCLFRLDCFKSRGLLIRR